MPTCIEKCCKRRQQQCNVPRHTKCCCCIKKQPVYKICHIYCNEEDDEENNCRKCNCIESDTKPDCSPKPFNVRVKLQLPDNDKSKNVSCVCAKYFEMLDACYGGMRPAFGNENPPRPGPCSCMPQPPQLYDIPPAPFLLNQQPIKPDFNVYPMVQVNRDFYNTSPRDAQYKENDTQTDNFEKNKCLNACEEFVEKLLTTKDTSPEGKETLPDCNMQTLSNIHSALAEITGTLQEIRKTLQQQEITSCYSPDTCEVKEKLCPCSDKADFDYIPRKLKVEKSPPNTLGKLIPYPVLNVSVPQKMGMPGFWPLLPKSMPPPPPPPPTQFRIPPLEDLSWLKFIPERTFNHQNLDWMNSKVSVSTRPPQPVPLIFETSACKSTDTCGPPSCLDELKAKSWLGINQNSVLPLKRPKIESQGNIPSFKRGLSVDDGTDLKMAFDGRKLQQRVYAKGKSGIPRSIGNKSCVGPRVQETMKIKNGVIGKDLGNGGNSSDGHNCE